MMQIATVRSQEIWLRGTPLFCPSVAGSALTPALALDYLGELSTDIEAVVVLDRDGSVAAATGDDDDRNERMRELFPALLDRAAAPPPPRRSGARGRPARGDHGRGIGVRRARARLDRRGGRGAQAAVLADV